MDTGMNTGSMRKGCRPSASRMAIGVGLATLLAMTGSALADGSVSSSSILQPPPKKLSADEWRAVSLASGRILRHADQAAAALSEKKNDVALANIAKGLTLVQIVDKIVPVSTVKTEIKAGDLSYRDVDQVKPTFVPIFREYDGVDIVSPVAAQQQKAAAGAATKPTVSKGVEVPEVTYAGFDYSGVKLNVRLARTDLLQAQDLIKRGDTKAATAALQDIQRDGVIFEFSSFDLPLARTMDNLRLAESELRNKQPVAAKGALMAASDSLKQYEKIAGESRSGEVQQLQKEIDDAMKNLAQADQGDAPKKIQQWWSTVLGWLHT